MSSIQHPDPAFDLHDEAALVRLFDAPKQVSVAKELDHVDANYAAWIRASPFLVLCTAGRAGLDASPRGDQAGFVEVLDQKTLIIPDRRGNNRIDSLRNLVVDSRIALLFFIPGIGETLRVNGRARINADPSTTAHFSVQGHAPKLLLVVAVEAVFFQCSRAVVRSDIWNVARHVSKDTLPTPGKILADATQGSIDGGAYDRELPERVKSTLY